MGVQAQFVLCGVHAVYVLVRRNMHGALATTQVAAVRVSTEACCAQPTKRSGAAAVLGI